MSEPPDPFVHVPELREEMVPPVKSSRRNLDLVMLDENMRSAGAPPDWRHSDEFREATRQATMRDHWHDDLQYHFLQAANGRGESPWDDSMTRWR